MTFLDLFEETKAIYQIKFEEFWGDILDFYVCHCYLWLLEILYNKKYQNKTDVST